MKNELIQVVLKSKIFTARQKWVVIRHIKQNDLTDEEMQKMMDIFANEQTFLEEAQKKADEQYLQDLQERNAELERLIHEELPKQRKEEESKSEEEDEAEAEKLLKEL